MHRLARSAETNGKFGAAHAFIEAVQGGEAIGCEADSIKRNCGGCFNLTATTGMGRSIMTKRIFATLGTLTLIAAAGALAQGGGVMKVDIPFDFHVGGTVLPAGRYDVHPQQMPGVLLIRGEGKAGVMILTIGAEGGKSRDTGGLSFHRYDNAYFLSTVWTPGTSRHEIPTSKVEREYARSSAAAAPVTVAFVKR
jgi:hypothetical protein